MAGENQIIINVVENDKDVQLSISTNVNLTSYGVCAVINSLLKALEVEVNWGSPADTAAFSFFMYRHLCKEGSTEVEVDSSLLDLLKGGATE